ncbi:RNase H-like domain-containing protein, partial [Acinetobacter baumannii]
MRHKSPMIGALLTQVDDDGHENEVALSSKKLNHAESRHSSTEQEFLAIGSSTQR